MSDGVLTAIRDLIQKDVGNRGLRADPQDNLITACADDFEAACHSIADRMQPSVAILTGFFIPHADPPAGETDGPLGALFLARALMPLGIKVLLVTDPFCMEALGAGLSAAGLDPSVPRLVLPPADFPPEVMLPEYALGLRQAEKGLTHLIAVERVGPSHTPDSLYCQPGTTGEHVEQYLREVPLDRHNRCHTMKGRDITEHMAAAHLLVEDVHRWPPPLTTIGIGDGGNEIGMGKIPWDVIRRNIPGGATVACRVPTDYLIVCGISNWGAYGLAAGVRWLRGVTDNRELFDVERERQLLRVMVEQGPLVDGVTGKPTVSVDGLDFDRYAEPLRRLAEICR